MAIAETAALCGLGAVASFRRGVDVMSVATGAFLSSEGTSKRDK